MMLKNKIIYCFLIIGVLGDGLDHAGAVTYDYGCVSPNSLGCFPNGALVCVNPSTDPNNCGSCNTACPTGGSCSNSMCVCPTGSGICSGACTPFTLGNCNSGCTACTASGGTAATPGEYCIVSGNSGTCTQLAGCVPATSAGTTVEPRIITVPGTQTISPAQCNAYCGLLYIGGTPNYFTLAVDNNSQGHINTICSCYTTTGGTAFDLSESGSVTCTVGSDGVSYYGSTSCPSGTEPCSVGTWQVYTYYT